MKDNTTQTEEDGGPGIFAGLCLLCGDNVHVVTDGSDGSSRYTCGNARCGNHAGEDGHNGRPPEWLES